VLPLEGLDVSAQPKPCFKEVEWTPEPYVDSGLLDGQGYNPIWVTTLNQSSGAAQQLKFFCEVPSTMYVNVQGPGVCWLYFRIEGVNPGVDQPHMQIVQANGLQDIIWPPGRHDLWVSNDGSGTCTVSIVIIERELRKGQLR
jgi:hypothetical protein